MARRRNPSSVSAWWVFGMVAGASALVAGVAYAAGSTPSPTGGATPAPTGGTTPTPSPTTPTPITQLVQGQQYKLHVTCPSPVAQPDLTMYPFLGSATILSTSPQTGPSADWVIAFTFTGMTQMVPSLSTVGGCSGTLDAYVPPWIKA